MNNGRLKCEMPKHSWKLAIEKHQQTLLNYGFKEENILGIFVYGSQNYNLDTHISDWDTKAIVIPTFDEVLFDKPVSREISINRGNDNWEHCEVKDIREFIKMFEKQNINFIEILFTEYKWINPKFQNLWEEYFINNREEIARYDMNQAIKSIVGQTKHTIKQCPTNGKKIANGYRLLRFLDKYTGGKCSYSECIVIPKSEKDWFLELKQAEEVLPQHSELLLAILENTYENYPSVFEIKKDIKDTMRQGTKEIIKFANGI